jgi:hypothetical protein
LGCAEKIQAGAKAGFENAEVVAVFQVLPARGQVVSSQKDMARLQQAIVFRVIDIAKLAR